MITFRLNSQAYTLPTTWADVPAALLPNLVACRLATPTMPLRLQWLQQLAGISPALLCRIPAERLQLLTQLLDWVWETELPGGLLREFKHQGTRFLLVAPDLSNATLAEYAVAEHHLRQFAQAQAIDSLAQMMGIICRPERRGLDRSCPDWDGDEREPFNARLAQDRACSLATVNLGVQQLVLAHFLAGQRHVHALYPQLFSEKKGSAGTGGEAEEGSPLIDLAYSLADQGIFGTFEQTCRENLYTVLEYLDSSRRRQDKSGTQG